MQPDIVTALEGVAREGDRLGLRMVVGGSVATSTYGVARATLDVDVVIDLPESLIPTFVEALEDDYYVEAGAVREAVRNQSSFNLIHLDTMVKIDVFVPKKEGFSRTAYEREVVDTLHVSDDAREFLIATPEDMILHKLVWYDLGDRVATRQWEDVLGVLQVQRDLDWDYLEDWADGLGVSELLAQARGALEE